MTSPIFVFCGSMRVAEDYTFFFVLFFVFFFVFFFLLFSF